MGPSPLWSLWVGALTPAAEACPVNDATVSCNAYYGPYAPDKFGNEQSTYPSCDSTGIYSGAEYQFLVTPPAGTEVTVEIASASAGYDLDLFVTDGTCDGACAGSSTSSGSASEVVEFVADGGTYVINADEDSGAKGTWSFDLLVGCESTCADTDVAGALTCSSDLSADTAGGTLALDFYSCGDPFPRLPQVEAEDIYTFVAQRSGDVTLRISGIDTAKDQDLYVLEAACDPDACVASDTAVATTGEARFAAKAGVTYYVVVEAPFGMGKYQLSADVGAGGCLEDCDDGVDNDGDGDGDCADPDCATDGVCDCADGLWFEDADDDGFGDGGGDAFGACGWPVPSGFVDNGDDCDDADGAIHPGFAEVCDGVDQDCDDLVDEGVLDEWFADADDDGHGDAGASAVLACDAPAGHAAVADDCDDDLASVYPGAVEACNQVDDDCDGEVDEDAADDSVEEICDGLDQDCDGVVDDGTSCFDDDGDCACEGGPCAGSASSSCGVMVGGDCDDANGAVGPGRAEVVDGRDNDCDGAIDEGTGVADDDGDGWTEDFGDCDDADPAVHVGADEVDGNGVDDDCDGAVDEGRASVDDDGDGLSEADGDCDDADPERYPGAEDVPADGVDQDCDGADNRTLPVETGVCSCASSPASLGGALWIGLIPWLLRRRRGTGC